VRDEERADAERGQRQNTCRYQPRSLGERRSVGQRPRWAAQRARLARENPALILWLVKLLPNTLRHLRRAAERLEQESQAFRVQSAGRREVRGGRMQHLGEVHILLYMATVLRPDPDSARFALVHSDRIHREDRCNTLQVEPSCLS